VLELFYTGLLVVVGLAVTWFGGYVLYTLFKGQA
jgi:uncharacterized membrane protein